MNAASPPGQIGKCPAGEEPGEGPSPIGLAAFSHCEFAAVLLSRQVLRVEVQAAPHCSGAHSVKRPGVIVKGTEAAKNPRERP